MHRRDFLRNAALGAGTLFFAPRMAFANVETDRRFVFIIQRGAADGLDTVIPHGDPSLARLRGSLAIDPNTMHKLDGMFALHPSLGRLADFYRKKQSLFVHAIASPYRERSHFDGQNVLESGGVGPYQVRDGWLNRLSTLLPKSREEAIAFAPTIPLALRGAAPVTSYAPSNLPEAPDDLLARVTTLYDGDAELHRLWSRAVETRGIAETADARQDPAAVGKTAAEFLGRADGPRIAMIETAGWDTHGGQKQRLANQLGGLDKMIGSLCDGLGDVWAKTTVLVATEFGRTATVNGTDGTDHGTAAAAMLIGGAVQGGRVVSDWPGLAPGQLYEGRDLAPTLDLDALIAMVAAESLGLDPEKTMRTLFPNRPINRQLSGLVA
ncbi:hypothetical protein CXZ10_18970 [Pleomorphomonas diazotrophica]|uniref:DUF1501 domain-containing protein n=1 Tax=Pleomorphomonas diazotrophica TaxID=1166257 RepID=A0A1I4U0C3_9HYPH|nr:DUF1501 domain-containing protein [Pleomorphomonas diazotrophica]PKR87803.1 hypothetical protein CXZ10_18970 [Pleomorphomonas diazotrophica]SFM82183.1 Uncharacterized conserved protein, DUF1501 family [Pleomorphomonas diazotrophica]